MTPTPDPIPDPHFNTDHDPPTPSFHNWSEDFDKSGWSKCPKDNLFITGFYRLNPFNNNTTDPISLLKQARCCNATPEFSDQDGTCESVYWANSMNV